MVANNLPPPEPSAFEPTHANTGQDTQCCTEEYGETNLVQDRQRAPIHDTAPLTNLLTLSSVSARWDTAAQEHSSFLNLLATVTER